MENENGQSSQDGRAPVCDRCICTCGTGDWCRGTKHWFDHAQRLATEYRALREGKAAAATGEEPCEHGCRHCDCTYYRPAPDVRASEMVAATCEVCKRILTCRS